MRELISFLVRGNTGEFVQEKEFVIFLLWSVLLIVVKSKLLLKIKGETQL